MLREEAPQGGEPTVEHLASTAVTRRFHVALGAVCLLAFTLRAMPLMRANGPVNTADYDEGVYVGASALLTKGYFPYRDFGFLHPPGIALLLAPIVWIGHAIGGYGLAFAASRWTVCVVGAVNTYLVARLATRWMGRIGGITAALLYATFFNAVLNEGRVELEPFLNAVCLTAALLWLRSPKPSARTCYLVGVIIGLAASIKLYGFVYAIPVIATAVGPTAALQRRRVAAASVGVFAIVVTPFVLIGGVRHTWNSVVLSQIQRPGGGDVLGGDVQGWTRRVGQAFAYGPLGGRSIPSLVGIGLLLIMIALAAVALTYGGRDGRFWVLILVCGLAIFLRSPSFFETYPVFLAPAGIALIAFSAVRLLEQLPDRKLALGAIAVILVGVVGYSARTHLANRYQHNANLPNESALVEDALRGARCVYSDPPHWALAADRLPDPASNIGVIDSFGDPFITAVEHGDTFATPSEARLNPAFQERLRTAIAACDAAVLGAEPVGRGDWTPETSAWFVSQYTEVLPVTEFGPGVFRAK